MIFHKPCKWPLKGSFALFLPALFLSLTAFLAPSLRSSAQGRFSRSIMLSSAVIPLPDNLPKTTPPQIPLASPPKEVSQAQINSPGNHVAKGKEQLVLDILDRADTLTFSQTAFLDSEHHHLAALFKCSTEEAFFRHLHTVPSNSVCWRLLPFSNPLSRALALRQTSPFGYRFHPVAKKWKLHKGIDFAAPTGSAVYAAGSGLVSGAGFDPLLGNFVRISHGFGWCSVYGHLSALYVQTGTVLRDTQLIGRSGSTGHSTGPHLHFGVYFQSKPVDGSRFLGLLKKLKGEN